MDSEYDRKFEEMKNYVPFLESMIKRLENTSGNTNPRQAQLDKIRSLRDLLLDKKKRMKMENLLKCEQVLVNLYAKVEQRDTLPGIDFKVPSHIKLKEEQDLDVVRNKLKIVTKMQADLPDTLPEIARASDSQDTSTAGAKEPALFQRRPNMMGASSSSLQSSDSKNSQPKRNYTRVLVSPEPSPQRWSKQDDKITEKPLFSRRSPRRQSPTHRKDRKQSKQKNSSKSNLNITLKVPEESLDSLNTSDIFSRIINCSDNDVDIATLRELRSQILGELKHTGAKDDISDLILNSTKRKKKRKSNKRKEEVEEGELSDSESEAIENIYGSLVILDKDQNTAGQSKLSNKQEQKPRKIQIRLVINSENEAANSDSPNTSDKKGLISEQSDISELEMFDSKSLETKVSTLGADEMKSKETGVKYDDEIAPKASELPDDESVQVTKEASPKNVVTINTDSNHNKDNNLIEANKKTDEKKSNDNMPFKPNFYKPLTESETENKESKAATENIVKDDKELSNEQNVTDKSDAPVSDKTEDVVKKDIEIPLLNDPSVASHKPKESVVSEIDILQALKNEILSEPIAITVADQVTPALHQPKLTKVANTQEIAPKKRISIEKYKQKSTPKPAVKPLFTSQSMKDDYNKKQSLKLTEKECERFKFALDELSSDDDDIYEDLNKSDEDDGADFAPKSPDNDESSNIDTNDPVIIPVDPVKNLIESSKADVDMRTLMPIVSPLAVATPVTKDILSKDSVVETKNTAKPDINRPSDPRLKRDSASLNTRHEPLKPVPPPLLGYPNISTMSAGKQSGLIPPLTSSPNMTPTVSSGISPSIIPNMTPNWVPNMTPNRTPIMTPSMTPSRTPSMTPSMTPSVTPSRTPSMTPSSRSFEIDDQPKRKHVYASLYDPVDYTEDIQRQNWEKSDNANPRWEPNDERERSQDRPPIQNHEAQKYNKYNDSRNFYNRDDNSVNRITPSHPFGKSDCSPTPSHSFGRSECPPTPSHPFGRLDCPTTPSHHFGRSEGLSSSHSFGRSECPMTPSHPFGRSECPTTPSHSFGRSECPPTPTHSFGRSEMPVTPSHPFGRLDPRLQKTNESNINKDDRNRRYFKDQSSYKASQPYNPIHDVNSKTYNVDNYRNREQSVCRTDRNRPNYYKEQNSRNHIEERMSRHETVVNRSRNNDRDQFNPRSQRPDNDYYHNDKQTRFREHEIRSNFQRERSVGRTNIVDDRQVRSSSRASSVGRNPDRDDEKTLSVKSNAGRSFTIDTSINSTFQDFTKTHKEKSIFDQLFDRNNRASSVGRTFVRETSVGRTLSRPLNLINNAENTNDRFRRARSVVRDTGESKSLSEIKADFESYRSKGNKRNELLNSKAADGNSLRASRGNEIDLGKRNDSKLPYSPRKNYRDPRLNRDPRIKHKDDRYRYDSRDKNKYGIIYSNDNIASGTILGSGYGVKNYKIPKIKRAEDVPPVTQTTEKIEEINKNKQDTKTENKQDTKTENKQDTKTVKVGKDKTAGNNKNKEKEIKSDEKVSKRIDYVKSNERVDKVKTNERIDNVKSNDGNSDKKTRNRNKKIEKEEEINPNDDLIARPRRSRRQIKDSESESEETTIKDTKSNNAAQKLSPKKKVESNKDQVDNTLDTVFGIDDSEIFPDNAAADPVVDSIDSLIADLDDDINKSKNVSENKLTDEISLESMLENINSSSANEVPKGISIDSALLEINKLIGNDESNNDNNSAQEIEPLKTSECKEEIQSVCKDVKMSNDIKISEFQKQIKGIEIQKNNSNDVNVSLDEKPSDIVKETKNNEEKQTRDAYIAEIKTSDDENIIHNDKTMTDSSKLETPKIEEESKFLKETDAIVSTTENIVESKNDQHFVRSTTPDSTNADAIPKEIVTVRSLPDSTDEVHSEVSEVSSSNTSAQISSKDPEPSSSNKEVSATSDPLGNILSILQSKSKLKELLSMLGDQTSDNDKIKKKLEKLSEIVSDEEDAQDGAEQDTPSGIDQESRDGTEMECIENNEKESKDDTQQDLNNESLEKSEDEEEVKDGTKITDKNTVDESNLSLDNVTEEVIVTKKNKTMKKIPTKKVKTTRKRNANLLKKMSVDEKRVTRSDINQQKPKTTKKKVSRELLKLQEDIKEMFISDDVLNVTGIRMCRLAKLVDDNSQKDISSKSDTEPVVVLEKINKTGSNEELLAEAKVCKTKVKKKPGPKSKIRAESSGDAEEKTEKPKTIPKYKPGPKSKTKSQKTPGDVDPYDFETDSINESNASKISESSIRDSSDSDSESLTSRSSFGSSEALSELKPLSELKKKPKRKRSSWKTGVIKPKNKKKKIEQKLIEPLSKNQKIDEIQQITIPDFNCFIDKNYCYTKNVFIYSCRLCVYSGEEIVAHYKKEHPHTEIPLSRLSPDVAKEAIEQCEEINFQAISKIPTDKYVCRFCFKEFGKKKAALESFFWHVVSMHTGEYKQICSECVNITRCPFNLDIPPPPKDIKGQLIGYICGKCNFTQISLENLKTHVIVRHNDEQTEVYTINLAVMSRKIINILSKRVSLPETDQPRVLRSSRSNQSMTEMSDDRSDATETNSFVAEPEIKEKEEIEHKDKRKLSFESKSKLQSKITFENDDSASDTSNIATQAPVKIERDDLEEDIGNTAINHAGVNLQREKGVVSGDDFSIPHFKVNYTETGTGLEIMCFINDRECNFKCSSIRGFRTHVNMKHRDQIWNGYCIICKNFVNTHGQHSFKDCLVHFHEKHMDNSRYVEGVVSEVHFKISYSESGIKQFVCSIDGHDHYQCSTLMTLKSQISTYKGKWNGYCIDCNEFVNTQGEYLIMDCLSHYMTKHNICDSSVSAPVTDTAIGSRASDDNQHSGNSAPNDIFAYPHFKVTFTNTGNKEFVCCINQKEGVHYKTPLLISLKRHVQTKHSENWDGYCFMCKVIVMPQGLHLFKDCLQHCLDKHMDDFPVLEKEPEKPVEEPAPPPAAPRPYINVRPLSQLKSIDAEEAGLVLPKIESVISLGAPAPTAELTSPPEAEVIEPAPPEPEPQPEPQIEQFHKYEASQVKVMSQKHPVVQEAMLRKEKLVRVFKCAGSFCSFATDSADMALSHALTHQKIGGENALCCSYCDFDCSGNAIDLVVHVFKHASCPFSCGYCFYRGAAAQLVVAHSGTAHPGKQVKVYIANNATQPEKDTAKMLSREVVVQYYVCNHAEFDGRCKFRTYTARKFCDHLQTRHTGEHSCYICSQSLPTATDLVQHMKSHDLNLYQCTWCIHGADSEAELLAHAASRHPTHQPQAYLRIITNKDGSSEMRVLPLASFNRSSIGVEHVVCSAHPEHPVKEAERSIDLQKLIGQTKLMFESIASTSDKPAETTPKPTEDMATISPSPANKTPPRDPTPQPDLSEQTTPILKAEPAEITPSKISDEIVCLDSDEETTEERGETSANVVDISTDDDANKPGSVLIDDEVFKCPKCLHCFKTEGSLKSHIVKCYNPNWPMACPHCHKMTQNRDVLVQHYITDHCKKYICSYCNREFIALKGAKAHMKNLHKVARVNVIYGTGQNNHMVVKDNTGPTRTAPKRKLSMNTVSAPPAKQMKRYGPQDIDQLPINPILDDLVYCSLCEFNTKVRLNMVRHLQLHAEQQPVPQTAPVNPVPHLETNEMHFDKMVNLASSSLAKEKAKEVGPIVSQIPPEAAARYPKYVPERQRYTCGAKDCSYTSVDESMLRCHWETLHSGTTDYRCVHCPPYQHLDKSKPLIAARIMLHLKMHDTSLYACSSCTYYYFKKQVVEKHITDSHKGSGHVMVVREEASGPVVPPAAAATMDLKPWQCGLCSFKSMLRPEVADHCSKYHQSKMQFKCAYCPFRTSTLENVTKHQTNSHPGRAEDIFYYYYREGSVPDEDGTPKWVKQRQKMGITEDPVVKTEASDGSAGKEDPPVAVAAPVSVDLNIVKREVDEKGLEGGLSVEELCRKFGQFCEPNGLRYKCCLCTVVTEDNKDDMQSHLYEELQYRKWRCSICSYKAFHKNGLHEHISTEHRGRMQETLPIDLPVDVNIERWVAALLQHQTAAIDKNKQNLLVQKVQTPGPSGLNAPQKLPEKPIETNVRTNFNPKELEDAFGLFGAPNNKEYCCPKCVFRTEKEELMKEHLESELAKIRWCCSICGESFQNYHEALTHCKSKHDGHSARPKDAVRDPNMRAAWVSTCVQTQKRNIPIEHTISPNKSLLRTEFQKNVVKNTEQNVEIGKFSTKELEDAFGQFGVANNKQFCCPKCVFRTNREEEMKEHLESELSKIRWICSNCPEKFQTYHEAQFHCKAHEGPPVRPAEAPRDPHMRAAWVSAVTQAQKQGMKAATNENLDFSPNKSQDSEDSLLVVRYEEKVPIPEPSTSRVEPAKEAPSPESDDEKLVIDEQFVPKKVGKLVVCPYCPFQSKHRVAVKEHMYRHFGLFPASCGYCNFTGYRSGVSAHLDAVHPHEPRKVKVTPLPKGRPTVRDVIDRRMRRKNQTGEWRFCLLCQVTFPLDKAASHTHGDRPAVFVKHGDIVINCKVCQTFRKDTELMEEHYASVHPDKPRNYFIYQILYHATSNESMLPAFKRIRRLPTETIDINDDDSPPRKVARKSTTKLPMQAVAKKSTTKLPCLYISEDEEYSFYGTKPPPLESYESVTTLMPFCNTMMPFTVKKLSEILQINPRVVVKDYKK